MVPASFVSYFLAMAGAGGALIGLLFVAISIDPQRTFGPGVDPGRQGAASGAYLALVNGFFISMLGLIPHANVGYVALPVGAVGVVTSGSLAIEMVRTQWHRNRSLGRRARGVARALLIVAVNVVLYGSEMMMAVRLLQRPHNPETVFSLSTILLGIYAIGLARAWQLLGAPRGVLRWLDPLHHLADDDAPLREDGALKRP